MCIVEGLALCGHLVDRDSPEINVYLSSFFSCLCHCLSLYLCLCLTLLIVILQKSMCSGLSSATSHVRTRLLISKVFLSQLQKGVIFDVSKVMLSCILIIPFATSENNILFRYELIFQFKQSFVSSVVWIQICTPGIKVQTQLLTRLLITARKVCLCQPCFK